VDGEAVSVVCQNPERPPHEIADGARKITLTGMIVWGQEDLRADWTGDYVFCSFQCLSEWAATRAGDHDGVVLREGTEVEQLQPAEVSALEAPTAAAEIIERGLPIVEPSTG
jgi:hypothetical protein